MRAWVFTHNNPSYPFDQLPICSKERYVVWQHEKVDTDHVQGYIELVAPQRMSFMSKWLPGAHFEVRRGTAEQARKYCMEEDTRVEGPWERGSFGGAQGSRGDIREVSTAISSGSSKRDIYEEYPEVAAKYPRFVETMLRYVNEDKVSRILEFTPREGYQTEILKILQEPADPRKIYWVYDAVGNSGKTYFAKYLVDNKSAYYTNGGKSVDLTYAYEGQGIVIFDYVRESCDYVGYGVIEQLKNGILMSTKYESGMKRYEIPHVVVFANFMPADGKFSVDRLHTFVV